MHDQLDAEFGEILRLPKSALIVSTTGGSGVTQLGAAYLDHPPWEAWPADLETDEPIYEMFVLDEGHGVSAMGFGAEVDAWTPLAEQLAAMLFEQLASAGLTVQGTIALTGSITPFADVSNNPHFDDTQFGSDENVGFVAILGSLGGPRVTTGVLPLATAPIAPTEIAVTGDLAALDDGADWAPTAAETGTLQVHDCEADRMVIFPQFGQLHSGPLLAAPKSDASSYRQLFVARGRAMVSS